MPIAALLATLAFLCPGPDPTGRWRAVLDLAGGTLEFALRLERADGGYAGALCNGGRCQAVSAVRMEGDSVWIELGDYAANMDLAIRGDSLVGRYHNVGRKGPRSIPVRASRGTWTVQAGPPAVRGRWDAWFESGFEPSPRVLEFREGDAGLEGTIISNSGDYGHFSGRAQGDSVALSHFDGSFVYLLTARLEGDTLRGIFHAGLRSQVAFTAIRSRGRAHLTPPTAVTRADTSARFRFGFPDLDGRLLSADAARFRGKVVLFDIFGTWCPTCHDAAPTLVELYRDYHARGLEIVGVAFEVTGDSATDAQQVRRYRDKFRIPFPLLLGGVSDAEAVAATLPQLDGFTAFPTTIFLGRDGRVRRVHAGFYGPATGAQHEALVREFRGEVERLLGEN